MATVTVELPQLEQQEPRLPRADNVFNPSADAPIARAKQKWNEPAINKWRILVTFISFAIVGANDGVYGVSYPILPVF